MYSREDIKAKGILRTADLFTDEYVKEMFPVSCESYCDWDENKARYFIGFSMNDKSERWETFSYMEVDKNTGNVVFLDYKLPSGLRMKKPIQPVRLA